MLPRIYISLLLSLFTLSCFALKVPSGGLGGGYSNDEGQPLPIICINSGPVTYTGANTGAVDYAQSYSLQDVQQQLGIAVGTHVGIGLFSASDAFNFAKTTEQQSLAETLTYRSTYQFKDSNYNIPTSGPILNPVGQQYQNDPQSFRQYCGDSYIAQIHNGAYLYVSFQLQFLSQADQENFDNHFSADFSDIFSLTASIAKALQSENIQGGINLSAYQVGGDPTQIGQIISSGTINCSLMNMSACIAEMQNILDYIDGTGVNSFPKQLEDGTKGAVPPSNAATVGYEPYDYNAIIHIQSKSQLTPAIISARDKLGNDLQNYTTLLNHAQYIYNIATNYNYVYDLYKTRLSTIINNLQKNISLLQSGGQTCFNNLSQCIKQEYITYLKIQPVSAKDIALPTIMNLTETYIDGTQTPEIFVDTNNSTAQGEQYRGTIAIPNSSSTPEYDIYLQMNGSTLSIVKYDHATQQLLATYNGTDQGNNQFAGIVNYPNLQQTGTWTGTLILSQHTIMHTVKSKRGQS